MSTSASKREALLIGSEVPLGSVSDVWSSWPDAVGRCYCCRFAGFGRKVTSSPQQQAAHVCRVLQQPLPPLGTRFSDASVVLAQRLRNDLYLLFGIYRHSIWALGQLDFDTAASAVPRLHSASRELLRNAAALVRDVHADEVDNALTWRSPEQWCMLASFVVLVVAFAGAMNRKSGDGMGFRPKAL